MNSNCSSTPPSTPTTSKTTSSSIISVLPFDCLYKGTRVRFRIELLRDYQHESEAEAAGFSFHPAHQPSTNLANNAHHHHLLHPSNHPQPPKAVPHLCYSAILLGEEYYLPPSVSQFPVSSITGVSIYPRSAVSLVVGGCCNGCLGCLDPIGGGKEDPRDGVGVFVGGGRAKCQKVPSSVFVRGRRLVLKFSRGTSMELTVLANQNQNQNKSGGGREDDAVVGWFMEHLIAGREHRRIDWPYRFFLNRLGVVGGGYRSRSNQRVNLGCWGRCWQSLWTLSGESGLFARKYSCGDFIAVEKEDFFKEEDCKVEEEDCKVEEVEDEEKEEKVSWLDFEDLNLKKKAMVVGKHQEQTADSSQPKLVYPDERCA